MRATRRIGRVGLEPTTCGLTHHFGFRRRTGNRVPRRSWSGLCLHLRLSRSGGARRVSTPSGSRTRLPAWLGVGISHRSPMLSAFTRAVSGAVLQLLSKSAALPVELPARGRLSAPEKVELLKVESRRYGACLPSDPPSRFHQATGAAWMAAPVVVRPLSAFYFPLPNEPQASYVVGLAAAVVALSLLVSITNVTRRFCSAPGSSRDALGTTSRVLP